MTRPRPPAAVHAPAAAEQPMVAGTAKLVRDRIPELLGPGWRGHVAGPVEYLAALAAKLAEEDGEYLAAEDPGELTDVLRVADAVPAAVAVLALQHGLDPATVQAWQQAKAARRGRFTRRLLWHGEPVDPPAAPTTAAEGSR
jgi:predicted house-cleaning noncanonical NTP pyrophosphatase (MazG superfamily)